MKNKKKRRRKTRKKRKGAGIKVYPGCMKFKNIIKRLEKENEELRKKFYVGSKRPLGGDGWGRRGLLEIRTGSAASVLHKIYSDRH